VSKTSFEVRAVITFKRVQARVEQLASGDDDDVKARRDLVTPEQFTDQTLRSVSLDRSSQLFRGGDTQPPDRLRICQDEPRTEAALNARAPLVHLLEFDAAPDAFVRPETRADEDRRRLFVRADHDRPLLATDRQSSAALGAPAFENEAPVLRAHSHQKPVRFLAVAPIWLERALALHRVLSSSSE
jgi:hypothetical protein